MNGSNLSNKLKAANWDKKNVLKKTGLFFVTGFLALIYLFPFYWLLMVAVRWPTKALYTDTPDLIVTDVSLANFVRVIESVPIQTYLEVSIILSVSVVVLQLVICSITAYTMTYDFYGKKFAWLFIILAMLIPFQTIFMPQALITGNLGLINTYPGLAIAFVVSILNTLILYNAFSSIPESIRESAKMDGASDLYILFGLYWPLSKPALATVSILAFVWTWNNYLWPLVVVRDASRTPLPLGLAEFQSDLAGDFALQYAFAIIVLIPIIVVFVLLQNQFIKSVVTSSLKQ
ncbi:carbohydrate ABC transporter permease [Natrialba sp. INN-245]|uniref:carbohydrate ABC transporter permease n=1 Tax=Natrialba sp. INN-245 TaxID=2690967 RepID=UPI0013139723|nr:carbohydrate ABC transporter permease [Natrialba sp. INN-245]MWV38849.1 ABC transporter permease subunit [Natrialba sp. INN-245]